MRSTAVVIAALLASLPALPSQAADICKAIAIRDVPADEAPDSILKKGETDTAITQYRIMKKTGASSFCSHGGYCYSASGLKLLNCKVGRKTDLDGPDEITYNVDVIRSKVPTATLRYDDLDNQLLEMGMCSACASNAADAYLKRPRSKCGQTVKAALEGNPVAKKALTNIDGTVCQ